MAKTDHQNPKNVKKLRYGWTTGACATAATKAALESLITGIQQPTIQITLPKGQTPTFTVEHYQQGKDWLQASIIKDAGDDPDVTHGALIFSKVSFTQPGTGISFNAGKGVGTITRPGLPMPVGEAAINPVPRQMMSEVVTKLCLQHNLQPDVTIEISVKDGENIAKQTLNGRLGIIGGISILGTTGIVVPYSCSAWIHSIHRGIDVARATNAKHIAACVGSTSEKMIQHLYPDLKEEHYIDMGDFVGGTLKYLRKVPIARVTVVGGFGKFSKLAQGKRDLHSKRSTVDIEWLAQQLALIGASAKTIKQAQSANTALEILLLAHEQKLSLADHIASLAQEQCERIIRKDSIAIEVMICDRKANLVGHAPFKQSAPHT